MAVVALVEDRVQVNVKMPPELKRKLVMDAVNNETNLTDLINTILAEHYEVEYVPRRKRGVPFGGGRPD